MALEGLLVLFTIISFPASAIGTLLFIAQIMGGSIDLMHDDLTVPAILVFILIFDILFWVYVVTGDAKTQGKTKGRECDVTHLEGIPDFEREQRLHLTLDVKNRVILIDGRKAKDVPSKHQQYTLTKHLKETQVRLRFQQIAGLSFIDWEGNVSRWEPGTMGFSAPLMGGVRMYARGSSGYAYTEKLKVDYALEIRYRDQAGVPARIVLKVRSRDDYVDKWLEALCRCTNLPAPQYVPPVEPEKPGPKYL